ncbi:MAG TPA: V-type ATPase subunit subunit G family protein [Meiothermus sp.]|jgi:colicin import membrane protein|nr:V-type ATPase subunit subunit G family protein [Meiothermus sp.]
MVASQGLIKSLAEQEQELARRLEEARRAAQAKLSEAEAEAARIEQATQQSLREMETRFRAETAEMVAKIEAEARQKAEAEAQAISTAAAPKIAGAVQEVLKEVLP